MSDPRECSHGRTPRGSSHVGVYRRRRPERTVLYEAVRQNLETWLSRSREVCPDDDPTPAWVAEAFRRYLTCAIVAHGFARARCPACGHDFLVAFLVQGQGCLPVVQHAPRMAETAAHLVDHVFPRVPVRQWVLSFPKRLRYFLHRDPGLVGRVLAVALNALERRLRRCAPGAPASARFGTVTFIQRFGSALNAHLHFHICVIDGVLRVPPGNCGSIPPPRRARATSPRFRASCATAFCACSSAIGLSAPRRPRTCTIGDTGAGFLSMPASPWTPTTEADSNDCCALE